MQSFNKYNFLINRVNHNKRQIKILQGVRISWGELEVRIRKYYLLSMEPKKLSISVAVPPAPVRVPSRRPLAQSVASVNSVANDKGDNEMILGAVHRSPGIYLTAE